jgi:hypothetical protein
MGGTGVGAATSHGLGDQFIFANEPPTSTLTEARHSALRIPAMATMHSDAWRPVDPVDDDQGGA